MHVRRTILCLAACLWATYGPDIASGQSSEFMEAYNRYSKLYAQGRYLEAIPFAEKAVRLGEREFGPDHLTIATLLSNHAVLYYAQGKYAKAEALFQRALAIREKALGPEHPDVAQSLENYAALLRETGRADKAEEMEVRARAIRAKHAEQNPTG